MEVDMADDWFDGGTSGSPVDVAALFDSEAATWLMMTVQSGALVSMGTTSDGGALGVTVTLDGRWRREYFRESEPLTEWLRLAQAAVKDQSLTRPASSGQRSRQRGTRPR
jgi:hypothetical protein